jgi:hypothetical protein
MVLRRAVRIAAAIALMLSTARVGYGQSAATGRSFHGLFGPAPDDQTRPSQLDLNWSLYGAQDIDDTGLLDLDRALPASQTYSGANMSLAYTRRALHKTLKLNATSATRYYPDLDRLVSTRYSGDVMFTIVPADRWQVQTSGTVSYSPFYQVVLGASPGLPGGELAGPNADYAAARQESLTYASYLGARRTFSPTSSMDMSYEMRYTQFLGAAQFADQRAGFRYTRAVSKSFALNLGYRQSAVTPVRGSEERAIYGSNVDIGLGYNRTLFSSSRTSISFTSGTSTVSTAAGSQFMVTGSARLTRQMSRLWTAQLLYDRGVQVPEGTLRPFFSDTVTGSISGYLNRRVVFRAFPSYARGTAGVGAQSNPYDSLSSTTRLEVALGRRVAVYLEHFYYRYAFANNNDLPPMLAGGLNRNGARVGLTLWTPVIR